MPELASFAAFRYRAAKNGKDVSTFLAPPYDVLEEGDKAALLAKNPRNIVAIDLPHLPPKTAGPPETYERSARMLADWVSAGTLVHDAAPALYLYHQRFSHEGRAYTRRQFVARARLTAFAEGCILPHERTFGGPKEDRLALMKATRCNLSAVFGLYSDPQGVIQSAFATHADGEPDVTGTLEGVENRLWVVRDKATIDRVVSVMADKKVYIADGHHRYETALKYRDEVAGQHGSSLPKDHAANFVMLVLADMEDPGCLILPYHRVVTHIGPAVLLETWSAGTHRVEPGGHDLVVVDGRTGERAALRFTDRAKLSALEPRQPAAWHQLDTAYLHRYLIDELLSRAPLSKGPDAWKIEYVKSSKDALRIAREESGVALLLNATPMAQLRAVSESGGLMPQKSTYFHPKLATGLTINPLYQR